MSTDTTWEPGCYVAGHAGQYGIVDVIAMAVDVGMVLTPEETRAVAAYRNGEDTIASTVYGQIDVAAWVLGQGELGDTAEAYLNEHAAPAGLSFGWHDGEFFLWSTEDWESA
jgi:hypothetical protein